MAAKKRTANQAKTSPPKTRVAKKPLAQAQKKASTSMTTAQRFVAGTFTKADLEPVPVKCPECGHKGFQAAKGRFGPVWRCLNRPECKHFIESRPTGKKCGHATRGTKCGALMVEGTKTIPDRCSVKNCPNRNPHRL
ncbi:MAG: ssDNA-binding Zn-finger/Zn-ribbon topoisomerase 1 [Planctomycetota bacterium]|jgi:ssDNA-binding Zn-finger/Zn-ribbon topoisomerase 1